jgi:hypothetical protein
MMKLLLILIFFNISIGDVIGQDTTASVKVDSLHHNIDSINVDGPADSAAHISINNIYFSDSILTLSDYVKRSRVSVFIATGQFCAPCHILIDNLIKDVKQLPTRNKVDIYLINVPYAQVDSQKVAYNSIGYQVFRDIDKLPEILPTILVYGPTKNINIKTHGLDDYFLILNSITELSKFCK